MKRGLLFVVMIFTFTRALNNQKSSLFDDLIEVQSLNDSQNFPTEIRRKSNCKFKNFLLDCFNDEISDDLEPFKYKGKESLFKSIPGIVNHPESTSGFSSSSREIQSISMEPSRVLVPKEKYLPASIKDNSNSLFDKFLLHTASQSQVSPNSIADLKNTILKKEKEIMDNLPVQILQNARQVSEHNGNLKEIENLLNLFVDGAKKFHSIFTQHAAEFNNTLVKDKDKLTDKTDELLLFAHLEEQGLSSSDLNPNSVRSSFNVSDKSFEKYISEISDNRLQDLILALKIIKTINGTNNNNLSENDNREEMKLLLAKSLFKKSINSMTELTSNQRAAINSIIKSLQGITEDEKADKNADSISRTFTVSDDEYFSDKNDFNPDDDVNSSYFPDEIIQQPIGPPVLSKTSKEFIQPPISSRVGSPSPFIFNRKDSSGEFFLSPNQKGLFTNEFSTISKFKEKNNNNEGLNDGSNSEYATANPKLPQLKEDDDMLAAGRDKNINHNYHFHYISHTRSNENDQERNRMINNEINISKFPLPPSTSVYNSDNSVNKIKSIQSSYSLPALIPSPPLPPSPPSPPLLPFPPSPPLPPFPPSPPPNLQQQNTYDTLPVNSFPPTHWPDPSTTNYFSSRPSDPQPSPYRLPAVMPSMSTYDYPSHSHIPAFQTAIPKPIYNSPLSNPQVPFQTYSSNYSPANPPAMNYRPPLQNPSDPSVPTRIVFLRSNKEKRKRNKKKHKHSAFSELFISADEQEDSSLRDFTFELDEQRNILRDQYWQSREQLHQQQLEIFELRRLKDEIKIQEKQREDLKRKMLRSTFREGIGSNIRNMFYRGAIALGALSIIPLSNAIGRRKRSLNYSTDKLHDFSSNHSTNSKASNGINYLNKIIKK